MSALGSQTTVDLFPVHYGIKSELLTRAFQAFHGLAPIKPSLLLPLLGTPQGTGFLLHCAPGLLWAFQSVPLHTGPAPRAISFTEVTVLHNSGGTTPVLGHGHAVHGLVIQVCPPPQPLCFGSTPSHTHCTLPVPNYLGASRLQLRSGL